MIFIFNKQLLSLAYDAEFYLFYLGEIIIF
jgi:hypothetical protein